MEKKKKAAEYSIEVPKHEKYFFLIRKFLENILSLEAVPEKEKDDIILAVNESCDKLFRIEKKDGGNIKVDIRVRINPKKVTITLRHRGKAEISGYFDSMSEDKLVMDSVKGKIGDYLIEKSADEVTFSTSKRKGHQVKITKFRNRVK
ncbi:MAG TPA: ATP-binding protein [Candidatus Goldiibacteriota bacterium]|nr:ATP-binding protein [Candidatus Goldiibacteriota bacterium]